MKKYFVDGSAFDNVSDAVDEILCSVDEEEEFEAWLADEFEGYVDVCGNCYDAVDVLRAMGDYESALESFTDAYREEIETRIDCLRVGEERKIGGCNVECTDADAELIAEAMDGLNVIKEFVQNVPAVYGSEAKTHALERAESLKAFVGAMAERMKEE